MADRTHPTTSFAAKAAPQPRDLIPPGRSAPAFKLPDQQGKTHALRDYRGRWVVLYFYPRDNTPGCTAEACDFRDRHDALLGCDGVILGVSPDDPASHTLFADKYHLPFPLLADVDQTVCRKYGVWRRKTLYGREFLGVVRTTYLIDPRGVVARRWDNVKVKQHIQQVLVEMQSRRGF